MPGDLNEHIESPPTMCYTCTPHPNAGMQPVPPKTLCKLPQPKPAFQHPENPTVLHGESPA